MLSFVSPQKKKTVMVSPTSLLYYAKWSIFFTFPNDAVDQPKLGVKNRNTEAEGLNCILRLIIAEFA